MYVRCMPDVGFSRRHNTIYGFANWALDLFRPGSNELHTFHKTDAKRQQL